MKNRREDKRGFFCNLNEDVEFIIITPNNTKKIDKKR